MKNHRFLWLRNRTTDNRKCEKARNIKEKRTIEMFSTVSKQLVALRSSARDNQSLADHIGYQNPQMQAFAGFLISNFVHWNARMTERINLLPENLHMFGYMEEKDAILPSRKSF